MFTSIENFLGQWLPALLRDQRSYVTVAIGCTGGQHRSVTFVERLAGYFRENPLPGVVVSVVHRDVKR
jgi:UPF0042 nucleotide-binding protein